MTYGTVNHAAQREPEFPMHSETPAEVAARFRQLAAGLTDPADIAAVRRYAEQIEAEERSRQANVTSKAA
jgi:hypothetical protein